MPRLRHWKLKVLIQFVLAHLPGGERLNYSLQRANGDHSPERIAGRIPELVEILNFISQSRKLDGLAIAEIGTGWVPLNTLLLYLFGARAIHTYDHIAHVRLEPAQLAVAGLVRFRGFRPGGQNALLAFPPGPAATKSCFP